MADWELWNQLQRDSAVGEMPCYPDSGCMALVDGVMVVKLGETSEASEGDLT